MSKDKRDEEEKEPKFRVIDRRNEEDVPETRAEETPIIESLEPAGDAEEIVTPDDGEETGQPAEDMGKTEMTQEEREAVQKEVEKSLQFKNTVIFILRTLSDQTWIHLGLIPNPISGLTVKNMDEARKLIDLFDLVVKNTEEEFEEEILRDIHRLLADLKVNYTNQLGS